MKYAKELIVSGTNSVGIITPYKAQVKEIRRMLKLANLSELKVGTAEEYQGREMDAIIVSTVRANSNLLNFDARTGLGFVSQIKRTCVTLTR